MSPPPQRLPTLTDGTVTLRSSVAGDVPAIDEGIHDRDVIRWVGPPEGTAADVLAINERRWASGSPTFSICELDGNCVGLIWVNVRDGDPTTGSVGYFLLRHARGRGIATASVRLVSRWATRDLGIAKLRLVTEPGNERSRLVAERSGFRETAVLHHSATIGGLVIDQVVYELADGPD